MNEDTKARVLARVAVDANGCWIFQGKCSDTGYGTMRVNNRTVNLHRFAYRVWRGEIPENLEIDHLCRVRSCCNPAHLEAVDRWTNNIRGNSKSAQRARQTHCVRGHPLSADNICKAPPSSPNRRTCKICHELRRSRYQKQANTERAA
jgi:hypothetical protein